MAPRRREVHSGGFPFEQIPDAWLVACAGSVAAFACRASCYAPITRLEPPALVAMLDDVAAAWFFPGGACERTGRRPPLLLARARSMADLFTRESKGCPARARRRVLGDCKRMTPRMHLAALTVRW